MQKNSWKFSCTTFVLGAVCLFLRWMQKMQTIDAETGLFISGKGITVLYILFIAASIVISLWMTRKAKPLNAPTAWSEAFHTGNSLYTVICALAGILIAAGGVLITVSSDSYGLDKLQLIFAVFAVFSGGALFVLSTLKPRGTGTLAGLCSVIPVLFCCFWLIFSYKANIYDPTIWNFAIEILAICLLMLAFYYLAGYYFGRSAPYKALFIVQIATIFTMSTLGETRPTGASVAFAGIAIYLLATEWVMASNLPDEAHE